MDGWMDGWMVGWMHRACMHVCAYVYACKVYNGLTLIIHKYLITGKLG